MKKIIIGIASLPEREGCLKDTIESLINQCDKIIVGLNNYKYIPDYIKNNDKIDAYILDNSLGDAAKFYKIDDFKNSYYFSCDDDIIYPSNYIEYMISGFMKYKVPVGLHGATMKRRITSFYNSREKVYHCLRNVENDIVVDYLGTGCLCFDTSMLDISIKNFKAPNMADVWFGDIMYRNNIKPVVLKHKSDLLIYNVKMTNENITTIFDKRKNDKIQTEIVKKWKK